MATIDNTDRALAEVEKIAHKARKALDQAHADAGELARLAERLEVENAILKRQNAQLRDELAAERVRTGQGRLRRTLARWLRGSATGGRYKAGDQRSKVIPARQPTVNPPDE